MSGNKTLRETVAKTIAMLCDVYSRPMTDTLIDAWLIVVSNAKVTEKEFSDAVVIVMSQRVYHTMPAPGEIISAIMSARRKKTHNAGCGACPDVRDYSEYFHGIHKSRLQKLAAGKAQFADDREREALELAKKRKPNWFSMEDK